MQPEPCILKHEYFMFMQILSMKANKGVRQSKSTGVFVTPIGTSTSTSTHASNFQMQVPHMLQLINEIWSQIYSTVILTIKWFLAKPHDTPFENHCLKQ